MDSMNVDDDVLDRSSNAVTMLDIDAAMTAAGVTASADALRNSLDVFDQVRVQLVNKVND